MARRFLIGFVLAVVPVVAVVIQPELRRVFVQDITLLATGSVQIAQPRPGDERLAVWRIERDIGCPSPEQLHEWRIGEYVKLFDRYGKPYLLASAVRHTTRGFIYPPSRPTMGPSSAPAPRERAPETEANRRRRQENVRRLLTLSGRLANMDPDNSFPWLMKCVALLALERNEGARQALHRAAQCSFFNDYTLEWSQRMAHRQMSAEERHLTLSAVVLPHFATIREGFRRLQRQRLEAQRQGDHVVALQLADDMCKADITMLQSPGTLIQTLVAISLLHISVAPDATDEHPGQDLITSAQQFAQYARAHGREDLAQRVVQEASAAHNLRERVVRASDRVEQIWEVMPKRLFARREAGYVLLNVMPFLLVLSVAGWMLRHLVHTSHLRRDVIGVWTAVLVSAGVPLAVVIGALWGWFPSGQSLGVYIVKSSATSDQLPPFTSGLFGSLPVLSWATVFLLYVVCMAVPFWRLMRANPWAIGVLHVGIALLLFTAAVVTHELLFDAPVDSILAGIWLAIAVWGVAGMLSAPVYARRGSSLPTVLKAGIVLLWIGTSVVVVSWRPSWVLMWLIGGLVLGTFWARGQSDELRATVAQSLHRLADSALLLALVCLYLYAFNQWMSVPVRAQVHQYVEQVLSGNEVEMILRGRT